MIQSIQLYKGKSLGLRSNSIQYIAVIKTEISQKIIKFNSEEELINFRDQLNREYE